MKLPPDPANEDLPPSADTETWLLPNGASLNERLEDSLAQIGRGEGMTGEQLKAFLNERRASWRT